jgi:hypothetical protein
MPTTSTGAIAGFGITEMGKIYGRTATQFAAEAIALALDDGGSLTPTSMGCSSTATSVPR